MIKTVIFDLYGTLVDIHTHEDDQLWDKFALYFSNFVGKVTVSDVKNTYTKLVKKNLPKPELTNFPEIDLLHVFEELFNSYGYRSNEEEVYKLAKVFRKLSTDYIKLYPFALELLQWLQEEKITIYLLSNAQRCFTIPELNQLGIINYFNKIYISSDYQIAKPDIRFINLLINEEQINVENAIFIGNDPSTDIKIAQAIGMKSIYLHSNCSPPIKNLIKADYIVNPICLQTAKKILSELI
jgi:putative hydrolase of the HAD superfamily